VSGRKAEELRDPGFWIFVVGPSGAGKDTLLAAARERLVSDNKYVFARRVITRPEDAGGEDHAAVSDSDFDRLVEKGAFRLHWQAHGLKYGIPMVYELDRHSGRHVIANVSRRVAEQSHHQIAPLKTVFVTASTEILAGRLALRGRESSDDIRCRLEREAPSEADVPGAVTVFNDGSLEEGVTAFMEALKP